MHLRNSEKQHRVCDNVSCIDGLSLLEYVNAYCSSMHSRPCSLCTPLITVGKIVLDKGYCLLSEAFRKTAPRIKYVADHARRKFLQMPLFSVRVGDPKSGQLFSVLMEKFSGIDYSKLGLLLNGLVLNQSASKGGSLE